MKILTLGETTEAEGGAPLLKISDIRAALRDENRVNIYINGKYEFSLDIAQVVEEKVKIGRILSSEKLENLRTASEFGKLYQRALEWTLGRPHSRQEVREYLKRCQSRRKAENRVRAQNKALGREKVKQYKLKTKILPEISDENLSLVLQRLEERGYVDDEKYAAYYIENRFVKRGVSRRRLEMELRGKGVATEVIEAAFQANPRDETEEIRKIIAKKARRYAGEPEKLIAHLTRQGFEYQLVQSLVREMD